MSPHWRLIRRILATSAEFDGFPDVAIQVVMEGSPA
jgi:hypothetical protein